MNTLVLTLLLVGSAFGAVLQPTAEGPYCPIDDPLELEAGPLNLTIVTKDDKMLIINLGSEHFGGEATGLTGLTYSYTVNYVTTTVAFSMNIEGVACAKGEKYNADGYVNSSPFTKLVLPTGDFKGAGGYNACIKDFIVSGSLTIFVNFVTGKISLSKLVITQIQFSEVSVDLGDFTVGNEKTDWEEYSRDLKKNFDKEIEEHGIAFVDRARKQANEFLKDMTLQDFWDLIGEGTTPGPCP